MIAKPDQEKEEDAAEAGDGYRFMKREDQGVTKKRIIGTEGETYKKKAIKWERAAVPDNLGIKEAEQDEEESGKECLRLTISKKFVKLPATKKMETVPYLTSLQGTLMNKDVVAKSLTFSEIDMKVETDSSRSTFAETPLRNIIGLKRRQEDTDSTIERQPKQLNQGQESVEIDLIEDAGRLLHHNKITSHDSLRTVSKPDVEKITYGSESLDITTKNKASLQQRPLVEASATVHNSTYEVPSSGRVEEMVLDPVRLKRILSSIDIGWDLDTISQCLRRDLVFRTSNPPCDVTLPTEALQESVQKMKLFAEFLFATSIFEDAFPLFLLVWITLRNDSGCRGTLALVQCARSATRPEDRVLVSALIKELLWVLDMKLPQAVVIRSLCRLELSKLCQQHGYRDKCNLLYHGGVKIISSSRSSLIKVFDEVRRQLQDDVDSYWNNVESYCLSRDIVAQAFDLAGSTKYNGMWCRLEDVTLDATRDNYTLRDVLLASMYIGQHHDRSATDSGVRHLRNCLKHAKGILERSWCEDSYREFREKIDSHWPGLSRKVELAVFFDLAINWSPFYPCEDLDIERENSVVGLSTLDIILTTSFLVCNGNDLQGASDLRLRRSVSSRMACLIALPNETLLLSFLWSSLRQNRKRADEEIQPLCSSDLWRGWMVEIFKTFNRGKWEEEVMFDPSPTMAMSLVTSSTLSAMRKHTRTVHFSSKNRQSKVRPQSTVSSIQQWISLTAEEIIADDISNFMDEFTVSDDKVTMIDTKPELEPLQHKGTIASESSNSNPRQTEGKYKTESPIIVSTVEDEIAAPIKGQNKVEDKSTRQPRDGG